MMRRLLAVVSQAFTQENNGERLRHFQVCLLVWAIIVAAGPSAVSQVLSPVAPGKKIYDSQEVTSPLLEPSQIAAQSTLPSGFRMQVVAREPDVQQPIAMAWDALGRLWVAENYTYAESGKGFDTTLSDRIIILEDTDGDNTFDKRKVFWDQGKKLTSIEIGVNGVWALAPPNLLFFSDENHDDLPEGPPRIVLDGFDEGMRHNVANGLRFGPDGWLYGRHGILGVSHVGIPTLPGASMPAVTSPYRASMRNTFGVATPSDAQRLFEKNQYRGSSKRIDVHCGIWRFNPKTYEFQVVTHGTTNPWGMDWDQFGNLFFINTVIGHLWHAIPNSHLQRMYGEDLDPYTYELLPQIADHVHWDEKGEAWTETRKGAPSAGTDAAGGGHAHSGMMIYQADQWPEAYRNHLFTLNFHGQRINQDRLERAGAGYVGRHDSDMVFWKDPWFRGIELSTGPDGSAYVLDWSDLGECHDDDGVHRHSGRIYRISYEGDAKDAANSKLPGDLKKPRDLQKLSQAELLKLLKHPNAWYARQALILLSQLRTALQPDLVKDLQKDLFAKSFPGTSVDPLVIRLRTLWALNTSDNLDAKTVVKLLRSQAPEELHVAVIKLVADQRLDSEVVEATEVYEEILELLGTKVEKENNRLMRLYLAALLPQLSVDSRLANILVQSGDLAGDRDFPLVMWYGIKDRVAADPQGAAKFCAKSKIPKLTELVIRRLASEHSTNPEGLDSLIADIALRGNKDQIARLINGMSAGYQGRRTAEAPKSWDKLMAKAAASDDPQVRENAILLQAIFAGRVGAENLVKLANDANAQPVSRRAAIESLGLVQGSEARETLWALLSDQHWGGAAATAIARQATLEEAKKLSDSYSQVWPPGKLGIIAGLSSKTELMSVLLESLENGKIPIEAIDASTWRQFQLVAEWSLLERARKLNPKLELAQDKATQIRELEKLLDEKSLENADSGRGRLVWQNACASCHKLFGEGGAIGPELTGAQRTNKRYWLENIVAPSALVAPSFQIELFRLHDDTIIQGVPVIENKDTITIQTAKEKTTIETKDVESRKKSSLSLMPEGLLDPLSDQSKRDLFKYLMSAQQIPLAK